TTAYGSCPGDVARAVNWRGFAVLFSDGATPRGPAGVRHFVTWEYQVDDPAHPAPDKGGNRPALKTANGVSAGVTVATLQKPPGRPPHPVRAFRRAARLLPEPPPGQARPRAAPRRRRVLQGIAATTEKVIQEALAGQIPSYLQHLEEELQQQVEGDGQPVLEG